MTYLIDTNICIYLIKKKNRDLLTCFQQHKPFEIGISAITVAEMEYGVAKSRQVDRNRQALLRFLTPFEILPFDDKDAEQFGILRAHLEKDGQARKT